MALCRSLPWFRCHLPSPVDHTGIQGGLYLQHSAYPCVLFIWCIVLTISKENKKKKWAHLHNTDFTVCCMLLLVNSPTCCNEQLILSLYTISPLLSSAESWYREIMYFFKTLKWELLSLIRWPADWAEVVRHKGILLQRREALGVEEMRAAEDEDWLGRGQWKEAHPTVRSNVGLGLGWENQATSLRACKN